MELAVISGKGGTGKSSISAAFASIAKNVVLADCDVDAANLFILFRPENYSEEKFIGGQYAFLDKSRCKHCGYCIGFCRFDAISLNNGKVEISEILCDGCKLCLRICPSNAIKIIKNDASRLYSGNFRFGHLVYGILAPGEENSGKLVNLVRQNSKSIAEIHGIKNIIIDGPPGIGCPVISSITGTNHILIVTEPSISALHDLKRTLTLSNKFQCNVSVLINKADINQSITSDIDFYCKKNNIPVIGKIPFSDQFIKAMVNRNTIIEEFPKSDISNQLKYIYYNIFNENE